MHEIQVTALNGGYASASGVCAPRCAFEPLRLRYQWSQRSGVRGVGLRPAEHISLDEQAEGVTLAFVGEVKAKPAHRRSSAPALPQPASPKYHRGASASSTNPSAPTHDQHAEDQTRGTYPTRLYDPIGIRFGAERAVITFRPVAASDRRRSHARRAGSPTGARKPRYSLLGGVITPRFGSRRGQSLQVVGAHRDLPRSESTFESPQLFSLR